MYTSTQCENAISQIACNYMQPVLLISQREQHKYSQLLLRKIRHSLRVGNLEWVPQYLQFNVSNGICTHSTYHSIFSPSLCVWDSSPSV